MNKYLICYDIKKRMKAEVIAENLADACEKVRKQRFEPDKYPVIEGIDPTSIEVYFATQIEEGVKDEL
jgi:hypothetical protein